MAIGATTRARVVDDLVEAFADDPVVTWAFPDPVRRRRHARAYFDLHAGRAGRARLAWHTDGGAALWEPPGAWRTSPLEDLVLAARSVRGTGVLHGRRVGAALLGIEARHPGDDHLYLAVVGVRPDRRGRGMGTRLLEPGLAHADAHHLPCYLESSNPRNVSLYERLGFEVRQEVALDRDGPVMTLMWRRPT